MPVFYILIVLAVIVLLLRFRVPIGLAMFAGTLMLGLLFGTGLPAFWRAMWGAAVAGRTLNLMTVVALVLVLSNLLHESGQFKRIMDALGEMVKSPKVRMASMPALIGLLPMPGGARFSAPMVEAAGDGFGLTVHRLSLINYWFRHIWEYSWPLYPGLLMTSQYLEGNMGLLVAAQFPLTLTAVLAGAVFVFPRRMARSGPDKGLKPLAISPRAARRGFALGVLPIVVIVVVFVALSLTGIAFTPRRLPMLVGLVAACAIVMLQNRTRPRDLAVYVFRKPALAKMMLMVLSVMVFAGVFEEIGASRQLGDFISGSGIPQVAVVIALPFAIGLLSGVTVVYVALAFPLIAPLIPSENPLPFLVLGFCFGFIGVLLSPVHLCLLLTRDYFRADMRPIYRDLLLPTLVVAAAGVALFFLLG